MVNCFVAKQSGSYSCYQVNRAYLLSSITGQTSMMRRKKSCTVMESISPVMESAARQPWGQQP